VKNKGFSLIELLIVISLMGIVYGLYFFTVGESKKNIPFSIENMKQYLNNASKTYSDRLKLVYYFDKQIIYLVDDKNKLLETIEYKKQLTQYVLKQKELLEVKKYKSIEIDGDYFEPTFIYEKINKDIFANLILNNTKNEWLYFNTYFSDSYDKFKNESELINFIKKKNYLPMYAGKPE